MKNILALLIAISFSLFSYTGASAQGSKTEDAEELFAAATLSLGKKDINGAERNFLKARKIFTKAEKAEKANECVMALATIEFLKGNYEKSKNLFVEVKGVHQRLNGNDRQRLVLIDQSIEACDALIKSKQRLPAYR